MNTVTISKPAAKVAAKPVTKAAAKSVTHPGAPRFALKDTERPQRGAHLASHTLAALYLFGMLDAADVQTDRAKLISVVGERALKYHAGLGNMVRPSRTSPIVMLTEQGLEHFRNVRTEAAHIDLFDGFVDLMVSGVPFGDYTKGSIVALSAD